LLGPFIMFLLLPFDSLVVNLLGISITVLFTLLLVFIIVPAIFGVSFGIRKVYMKTLLKIFQVSHVFRIFCAEECSQCLIKRINVRRRSFYLSVGHSRQQGQEYGLLLMCWCQMTCCSHLSQVQLLDFCSQVVVFFSLWFSH